MWIRVSGVSELEWSVLEGGTHLEAPTLSRMAEFLRTGTTFVDGANIGLYTLRAASLVGSAGRVIAFEPGPTACARLRENARLNHFDTIQIVEAAVSDGSGETQFYLGDDSEGSSQFQSVVSNDSPIIIPKLTLDDELQRLQVAKVDLLKIDAEGAEVAVLRGAAALLSRTDAPAIMIEANPVTLRLAGETLISLKSVLRSHGYSVEVLQRLSWQSETVENWLARKAAVN